MKKVRWTAVLAILLGLSALVVAAVGDNLDLVIALVGFGVVLATLSTIE